MIRSPATLEARARVERRERRERIATAILAREAAFWRCGISCSSTDDPVIQANVRTALLYADALISELDRR